MKKKILIITTAVLAIATMSFDIVSDTGKAGYTGSTGTTNTCRSCHTGQSLNAAGGSITISSTPTLTGDKYIPGQTYAISVTIARTGVNLYGFDFEALKTGNTNGGTLSISDATHTQTMTLSGRTNVTHKLNGGAGTGTHTFTFNWKAPAKGTGAVTFFTAGIAANGNGGDSGDYVYSTSKVISEDSSIGIDEKTSASNINLSVYPNPVVETATISYELVKTSQVSAKLISLNGQVITEFFKEQQIAGKQQQTLIIDPSVAKGIYFLTINVDGEQSTQKLIIK
jgi:hypothetical protein